MSSRPVVGACLPVIVAVGMVMITGRYWFLAIIVLGPLLYVWTNVRDGRRREGSETSHRDSRRQDQRSGVSSRPDVVACLPVISGLGMAMITGRYWFLAIIVLGPILYIWMSVRDRRRREGPEISHRDSRRPRTARGLVTASYVLVVGLLLSVVTGRYWFAVIGLGVSVLIVMIDLSIRLVRQRRTIEAADPR